MTMMTMMMVMMNFLMMLLQQTVEAWRTVFYLGGAVYAFGTIFFAIFGSAVIQPWALPPKSEETQVLGEVEKQSEKDREAHADNNVKEV